MIVPNQIRKVEAWGIRSWGGTPKPLLMERWEEARQRPVAGPSGFE